MPAEVEGVPGTPPNGRPGVAHRDAGLDIVQRYAILGRLAGSVAHDIGNLVTAITGYADLVRESLPEDDPRIPDLDGILEATSRCHALTRQLVSVARPAEGRREEVELNQLVEETLPLLAHLVGRRSRLAWTAADGPLRVVVDPVQLHQVIMNLVVNARDALDRQPGRVTLRLGRRDRPARAVLTVSDDGAGMDATVMARMFEPFFTTKTPDRGTGLGLSTVRSLVEGWGGEVVARSRPGQGTTVEVTLPVSG